MVNDLRVDCLIGSWMISGKSGRLKDNTHGIRAQPEDNFWLTSRLIMNIVIRSERESREFLYCDGS